MIDLPRHDADAEVVCLAVSPRAVVEVAVIAAATVFNDRAEEQFALRIGKLAGETNVQPEAFRIDIGAAFRPHG